MVARTGAGRLGQSAAYAGRQPGYRRLLPVAGSAGMATSPGGTGCHFLAAAVAGGCPGGQPGLAPAGFFGAGGGVLRYFVRAAVPGQSA